MIIPGVNTVKIIRNSPDWNIRPSGFVRSLSAFRKDSELIKTSDDDAIERRIGDC